MRLVRATAWVKETFELGSRPKKDTVVTWIRTGEVPGRLIGGVAYVDADGFVYNAPEHELPEMAPSNICHLDLLR
jgi:hypothetical protein